MPSSRRVRLCVFVCVYMCVGGGCWVSCDASATRWCCTLTANAARALQVCGL